VHARVRALVAVGHALGDRAGDEVDAQLARGVARPGERRAVERLGAGGGLLGRAQQRPLLGQDDELGAGGGGRPRQAVGAGEVALAIGG
jgi:hypothetical protein